MLIILAGLPATGKTTAKQFLLDMGYRSIDNIGIEIIQKTMDYQHPLDPKHDHYVYVINLADVHTKDVCDCILQMRAQKEDVDVLYFDASEDVLYQRMVTMQYNTEQGISSLPTLIALAEQRQNNQQVKAMANLVIDSGMISRAQMRHMLVERYIGDEFIQQKIVIEIVTFSYQCGMIRDANLVLDLRSAENSRLDVHPENDEDILSELIPLIRVMLRRLERSDSIRFCIGLGGSTEESLPRQFADELKKKMQQEKLIATIIHRDLPPGA